MERSTKRRRWYAVLATTALVLSAFASIGAADDNDRGQPDDQHCVDQKDNPKVEAEGEPAQADETITVDGQEVQVVIDGDTVNFYDEDGNPISVDYCIKAASDNSGPQEGHEGKVDWTNRGGDTPDISYVVVYGVADGDEQAACPPEGEVGGISLTHADGSDDPATNVPGDEHTVTATATDADGNACPDVDVLFEVTGDGNPTPDEGDGTTDGEGEADFSFNNDEEGANTVTACTNDDGELPESCDDADHSATVTKNWEDDEGPPPAACPNDGGAVGDISLEHADGSDDPATNEPGDEHTVTATVTDADGNPCPDVGVLFEVDGDGEPTWGDGSDEQSTDESGEAEFSFNNSEEGTNTVTACTNEDGSLPESCDDEGADHSTTLTKIWEDDGEAALAMCRQQTVNLFDEALVLFQANEDGEPCETEDGSLLNEDQIKLVRSETNEDDTSATGEVVGLGGPGDPGNISVVGTHASCDEQDAYVLLLSDGEGEELLRLSGEDNPLPNLAMDDDNGIFLTRTSGEEGQGGTAETVAVTLTGTDLVVLSSAESGC